MTCVFGRRFSRASSASVAAEDDPAGPMIPSVATRVAGRARPRTRARNRRPARTEEALFWFVIVMPAVSAREGTDVGRRDHGVEDPYGVDVTGEPAGQSAVPLRLADPQPVGRRPGC